MVLPLVMYYILKNNKFERDFINFNNMLVIIILFLRTYKFLEFFKVS